MPVSVLQALLAAVTFGLGAPLAKLLLDAASPLLLAGLLYLGAGLALTLVRVVGFGRPFQPRPLQPRERGVLFAVVASGGIVAPPLLLWGLARGPASAATLLLNLEVVFTVLLAGTLFGERLGRRVAMAAILMAAGGAVLGWPGGAFDVALPSLAVAGACLFWALDNNLTRLVGDVDAVLVAQVKGLAAGAVNTALALATGAPAPSAPVVLTAFGLGAVSYGASLVLFILAMRGLGAARTGAYFALAPFVGAVAGIVLLGERVTAVVVAGAGLMAGGSWLLVRERHRHRHRHEAGLHSHRHVHDEHHQHAHQGWEGPEPHTHPHAMGPLEHSHAHVHDLHHDHGH
jgi:drug/metabolite transporter (DMT)-like permease